MNDRRLRVLIVHNRYRSAMPSGEDRVVDQEMSLLAEAGHHVSSFEKRSDDITSMSAVDKLRLPLQVPWNAAARTNLRNRLQAERPDVVHVHNTFPLLSPSVLAACSDVGVPVVATLHNYLLVCPVGTLMRNGAACTECTGKVPLPAIRHGCYRGSRLATVPMAVNMLANRGRWCWRVACLFCVSDAQRKILVEAGIPAQRLAVKHHFVADPGRCRTGNGEHVLYLGRMTEDKGVRLLLTAWELIDADGGVGVPLVLAGDGPLSEEVRCWAADRRDVRYLGLQSRAECRELTLRAAAVVAPSQARETFGLVLAEAMAAAVPVVAAAHGGFTELVQHHVTGFLHRPGDAASLAEGIHRVLIDSDRNRAMGVAARKIYEVRFAPAAGLAALVAGYESAMASYSERLR